jgi:tetratricopeptide (TPR) repeat protein
MRARPAERVDKPLPWGLAVFFLTCLALAPALTNGWVDFDDTVFVLKNARLYSLSLENLKWMFGAVHGGHYHPLTWLSFAVNIILFGNGPSGFHAVDLLLHAANAALVFLIARRWLKSEAAAAAAALFFGLHPLRVESVAWAIERRDTLSGFFYLATILLHLKAIDEPRKNWRPLSWLCFSLSLLAKGAGITLPLALVLMDFFPLKRDWKAALKEKLPYFALAAAGAAAAFLAEAENGSTLALAQFPLAQRLAVAAYGLAFYLRATLVPWNLRPLYELPAAIDPTAPRFVASGVVSLVFLGALLAFLKRRPAIAAAGFFYLITILPMLGLVRFGPQLAADRYSYLSCLGFALLFGGALELRPDAAAVFAAWLAVLGGLTWVQTTRWKDAVTLWRYALEIDPDVAMGQQHLGYALAGRGQYAQAVSHYQRAVALKPDYAIAYDNLGWSLAALGRLDEAQAAYAKAIELKPDFWEARSNLGLALGRANKLDAAREEFQKAIAIAPAEPGLHSNLGLVYFTQGRKSDAQAEFLKALALDPNQRQARMMLGRIAGSKPAVRLP